MKRLADRFALLASERRKALSLYVTAGAPSPEESAQLILALAAAGADMIEIGIPFSDPIADGPTIQASSARALAHGMTLERTLGIARAVRASSDVPILLMGYANPVYAYGVTRFIQTCAAVGVDGTIIPDLPLEESAEYRATAALSGLASILLAAPTSSDERLRALDEATSGFLYCVSVAGVTGARAGVAPEALAFIARARAHVRRHPLLAGFGIATPADARLAAAGCDGVVVGSALVSLVANTPGPALFEKAAAFTRELRTALDS